MLDPDSHCLMVRVSYRTQAYLDSKYLWNTQWFAESGLGPSTSISKEDTASHLCPVARMTLTIPQLRSPKVCPVDT